MPLSEWESSQSSSTPLPYTLQSFPPETAAFRKSQHLLHQTIGTLLRRRGVARVLFITVTFKKPVRSTKRAQKELGSFLNAVRKRYGDYL